MTSDTNGSAKILKVKHKTLLAYYPIAYRLEDCFEASLQSPNDNAEYTRFISTTLCATKLEGVLPIPDDSQIWHGIPVSQRRSQQECVDWIMGEIGRRDASNLLLKRARGVVKQEDGIITRTAPSAVLNGAEWRCLRDRVGDSAFRDLIVSTSIFTLVGNNSFVQIAGGPIHGLSAGSNALQSNLQKRKRGSTESRRRVKKRRTVDAVTVDPRLSRTTDGTTSPSDRHIARQRMFYGQPARTRQGKLVPGLHPQHILNTVFQDLSLADEDRATRVYDLIFGCLEGATSRNTKRDHITMTLQGVLKRHIELPYGRLVQSAVERAYDKTQDGLQPLSHSQVSRYLGNVLDRLLGLNSVGSRHNMQIIKRHARLLVTAKQFEPITLHMLMTDLCIGDFPWFSGDSGRHNAAECQKRRQLVEQFIFWLFNDYLISLLRNTFYITETAQTRYQTVYYPHEAWAKATKPAFEQLKKDHLEPLSMSARNAALNGSLSVSAVRLIPKPNGFRPIVNLGKRQGGGVGPTARAVKAGSAANEALRGVHQILTYEKERNRDILGSSLFGTNEIFAPLHGLQTELEMLHGDLPRLYFVKMDIKSAFDTIKQEKVLQVVGELLDEDFDYILMMFCMILPPASKASQGSARRLFKTRAVVDDGLHSTFGELARAVARPMRNAILVDLLRQTRMTREECTRILRQHVTRNIWQVGNQLFRQREGIPQGSKISSMLCSIFYAAMERQHLSRLSKPGSRLLRYIDDFLYITDDYESARRFINIMSTGFPAYGASVSKGKTLTSFEHARGNLVVPVCAHQQDGSSCVRKALCTLIPVFPFCGFMIDTKTLELSPDIPRMIAGDMQQSFALRFARHRGKAFVGWLSRQLENRNHIAYLDTAHNSVDVVYLNIFLNFVTTAMKIPHYFDKSEDISPHFAKIIFDSICTSVGYTHVAGRARVRHAARDEPDGSKHYLIRKSDFEYLAKSAMIKVLERKAGRFKDILHLLKGDLGRREYRHLRERHQATADRGWSEVLCAKY